VTPWSRSARTRATESGPDPGRNDQDGREAEEKREDAGRLVNSQNQPSPNPAGAPIRAAEDVAATPATRSSSEVGIIHPDFIAEQQYIEAAHEELERARVEAAKLHDMVESGRGGTHQARFERDVIADQVSKRVTQLDIGDASLVFGRIDQSEESGGESFYIGRVAVWDEHQDPVTVDWRAPVSESFYRATGREPMGLVRRRHFTSRGRTLLGIEDEYFGDG
jgi:hypothetical protein